MSHSTRVRGLKFWHSRRDRARVDVALYTSAWIEILFVVSLPYALTSHSTRVRGLKLTSLCHRLLTASVALYTSAWIEILALPPCAPHLSGRTLHECVD